MLRTPYVPYMVVIRDLDALDPALDRIERTAIDLGVEIDPELLSTARQALWALRDDVLGKWSAVTEVT